MHPAARGRIVPGVRIETFIFDFDGTLADTLPICIGAYRRALEINTGRTYTDEEIVAHFGLNEEGILRQMAPHCWQQCVRDFLTAYEDLHDTVQPLPGVREMLDELKAMGARLALVTGKGGESARISLERLGLTGCFDAVEVGNPERNMKADQIRTLLETSGTPGQRAAYVGDSPSDMDSAREAGVLSLAAAWFESADPAALESRNPAAIFRTLEEFLDWARKRVGGKGG